MKDLEIFECINCDFTGETNNMALLAAWLLKHEGHDFYASIGRKVK